MISLAELQESATDWGLPITTVERDYVLGWMLWAIGSHQEIKERWIFKGGTCLKKCYMETWRFSEDLDFSLLPDSPFNLSTLQELVVTMLSRIQNESGIDFSVSPPLIKMRPGDKSAEGRVYFRSITGMSHSPLSIKLDLTVSEPVITTPVPRKIHHTYGDSLPAPAEVFCYSFSELFAEKVRAMGERSRPRDLYDIINLFWRNDRTVDTRAICNVLDQKCKHKGIPLVTYATIEKSPFLNELKSEWGNMLKHQLKELPPYEHFWSALPDFFNWLHGASVPETPVMTAAANIDTSWSPPPSVSHWSGIPIETIRFAAANRLCVNLGYQGSKRLIEPYALQKTRDGNIILVAAKHETQETHTYRIDRIESAEVTQIPFSSTGNVEMDHMDPAFAPYVKRERAKKPPRTPSVYKPVKPKKQSFGPTYVYECSWCHKKFNKKIRSTSIGKHKMKNQNYPCNGRTGWLVDTKY